VGDILTIKGDYLNLLHGIIFADKDTVREDKFIAHDRYTIQVAIPAEAKSGKFILTDLAETPTELESEDAITINLPTTSNVSNVTPKAGQKITITGVSLNQIAAVKLNGAELTADDLTISEDGKSLSFVVPATATDGEITLITKSGVSIPAGEIETVVPEDCVVIATQNGDIKRVPANAFKIQKRNGKGVKTADDAILDMISTNTVDTLMFFTDKGKMYRLLVDKVPVGTNASKGGRIGALINLEADEKVIAMTSLYRKSQADYVIFITK
jgi:DNA gyrase/topoisomerase IV subunit A